MKPYTRMMWTPRDPKEKRRIVWVVAIVWSTPSGMQPPRRLGAVVLEDKGILPGAAFVHLGELGKLPLRKDSREKITQAGS